MLQDIFLNEETVVGTAARSAEPTTSLTTNNRYLREVERIRISSSESVEEIPEKITARTHYWCCHKRILKGDMSMLKCRGCSKSFHLDCLQKLRPGRTVPDRFSWYCTQECKKPHGEEMDLDVTSLRKQRPTWQLKTVKKTPPPSPSKTELTKALRSPPPVISIQSTRELSTEPTERRRKNRMSISGGIPFKLTLNCNFGNERRQVTLENKPRPRKIKYPKKGNDLSLCASCLDHKVQLVDYHCFFIEIPVPVIANITDADLPFDPACMALEDISDDSFIKRHAPYVQLEQQHRLLTYFRPDTQKH